MSNQTLLERAALFNKHDWHGYTSEGVPYFCFECIRLAKFIGELVEEERQRHSNNHNHVQRAIAGED